MAGNPIDPGKTNARPVAKNIHVNWGHASASQLKRMLTDAAGVGASVLKVEDSAADECGVCTAFE